MTDGMKLYHVTFKDADGALHGIKNIRARNKTSAEHKATKRLREIFNNLTDTQFAEEFTAVAIEEE